MSIIIYAPVYVFENIRGPTSAWCTIYARVGTLLYTPTSNHLYDIIVIIIIIIVIIMYSENVIRDNDSKGGSSFADLYTKKANCLPINAQNTKYSANPLIPETC